MSKRQLLLRYFRRQSSGSVSPFQVLASDQNEDNEHNFAFSKPLGAILLVVVFTVIMLFYLYRAFALQVVAGEEYRQLANGNRIREVVEYAERGTIYDRDGEELAESVAGYQLTVTPYLLPDEESQRVSLYQKLAKQTHVSPEEVKSTVEQEGLDYVLPIAIGNRMTQRESLLFETDSAKYQSVSIDVVPTRSYDRTPGLSHLIGYTSLVSEVDMDNNSNLSLVDHVGRSGLEQQYDQVLRGQNGYKRYEVDAHGQPVRLLASQEAVSGKDIHLTIDLDLQKSLARNVTREVKKAGVKRGSGVAVHPETGAVWAMVSVPDYDNNLFARGITQAQYQKLLNDKDEPMYNKSIAGGYPSGSIIKPLVALAGLEEGVVNESTIIHDRGYIDLVNRYDSSIRYRFYGWDHSGLGAMNVRRALAMSSNIYFFTVGGGNGNIDGLGAERLTNYYQQYGLGSKTGIDLPGEGAGLVPTPEWKEEMTGQPWTQGDTYNISIGQGDLLISPLQITMANNSVINRGKVLRPHLLGYIEGQEPVKPKVKHRIKADQQHFTAVREGMHEVVTNGATNPGRFAGIPVKFGGKSGTAETNTETDAPSHAWFTAFAPYDNPEVTTTIFVENGGGGSFSAAPAVAGFLEDYFKR